MNKLNGEQYQMLERMWSIWNTDAMLVDIQIGTATLETVSTKPNIMPSVPGIPLLGTCQTEMSLRFAS